MKKIACYLQVVFYMLSGINHFRKPDFYILMIPPYLPAHQLLNGVAGAAELLLGAALFFPACRKWAALAIILMLLAFIPAHTYFIQMNSCIPVLLCLSPWTGWVRLVIFHPLLIAWAWWCRK